MEKNSGKRDEGGWDVMAGSREESTSQSVMERASVGLMRIKARRELSKYSFVSNPGLCNSFNVKEWPGIEYKSLISEARIQKS